jgi:hypothetical protein
VPTPVTKSTAIAVSRQEASFGVSPAPTFSTALHEAAYRVTAPTSAICNECGVVEAVREIAVKPKGSGGGAIAGGLVRFDDDSTRTFSSESVPARHSGDRVKLQNGLLTRGGGRSNGNPETI